MRQPDGTAGRLPPFVVGEIVPEVGAVNVPVCVGVFVDRDPEAMDAPEALLNPCAKRSSKPASDALGMFLLHLIRGLLLSQSVLAAENLALRQQLAVLKLSVPPLHRQSS